MSLGAAAAAGMELRAGDAATWVLRVVVRPVEAQEEATRRPAVAAGLGTMLGALVRASAVAARAESVGHLAGDEFWDKLMEVGTLLLRNITYW